MNDDLIKKLMDEKYREEFPAWVHLLEGCKAANEQLDKMHDNEPLLDDIKLVVGETEIAIGSWSIDLMNATACFIKDLVDIASTELDQ